MHEGLMHWKSDSGWQVGLIINEESWRNEWAPCFERSSVVPTLMLSKPCYLPQQP